MPFALATEEGAIDLLRQVGHSNPLPPLQTLQSPAQGNATEIDDNKSKGENRNQNNRAGGAALENSLAIP